MTLVGATPAVILLSGAIWTERRGGTRVGLVAIGAALAAVAWLARAPRWGSSGTFDGDPFSLFLTGLILVALGIAWVIDVPSSRSRRLATAAALVLAISSRNVVWIFLGFEAASLAYLGPRRLSFAASATSMSGLLLLAVKGGTDLAFLEPSPWAVFGLMLFSCGLVLKWLTASTEPRFESLAMGVALVAYWVRLVSWSPEFPSVGLSLGAILAWGGMTIGGLGAAFAGRTRSCLAWIGVAQVSLAILGTMVGAPSLPHVLMHLAASTLTILLLASFASGEKSRSLAAIWILALSLASLPPFAGFVTKFPLLATLPVDASVAALLGTFLVGIGCARLVARVTKEEGEEWPRTVAALAVVLLLGPFANLLYSLAARAATGLF
ncbi:MAG: hypothetical protein E2P02_25110 [Acidobacteria bacterium]|nr:MAG: hypothetical protein E2P02_25110 [Acidobacteriota bacterium]